MSRPDRWWRPATTRRPGQRARARRMYSGKELDQTFDIGYTVGQSDERKRHERLNDGLQRLNDAIRASHEGDPGPLDDLGVSTGSAFSDVNGDISEHLVDEVERWLREQE